LFISVAFFFSSRRRHTRSKRDWSSDVCSSDLCFYDDISFLNYLFNIPLHSTKYKLWWRRNTPKDILFCFDYSYYFGTGCSGACTIFTHLGINEQNRQAQKNSSLDNAYLVICQFNRCACLSAYFSILLTKELKYSSFCFSKIRFSMLLFAVHHTLLMFFPFNSAAITLINYDKANTIIQLI